ncbi:MAG TPA: hypothetical protein VF209_04225 [Patescibacteria group bacterium]
MVYKWQQFLAAFFIFLGLGIVGWGIVAQNRRLSQSQDPRSEAAPLPNQVNVGMTEIPGGVEKGKSLKVDLTLNSNGLQLSGFELWGTIEGIPLAEVKLETVSHSGLVPITQSLKTVDNQVVFHFVWFSDIGVSQLFSTKDARLPLGRIVLAPTQFRDVVIKYDQSKSDIASYTRPDIALHFEGQGLGLFPIEVVEPSPPASSGSEDDGKKECNLNCATDTECKSQYICFQGRCRDPQDEEDEKCGSKPDLGLQRQCNQYCADTRECAAGFTCYYNFCRNPQNLENTECRNPASPTPRPTTTVGTGGVRPSPSPSPSPRVTANVIIDPQASTVAAQVQIDPSPATRSSIVSSPRPPASPTSAPRPSIVPLPAELQPGAERPSIRSTLGKVGLALLLLLAVGFAVWRWRQHRTPTDSRDY